MITEEQKKRIVQEILKTSIIASSTYYGKPCLVSDSKNNNYIISGQKYKGCSDEDMCDFTVGYYNVVYEKDILKSSNITEIFAGDTMIDNYKKNWLIIIVSEFLDFANESWTFLWSTE